MAPSQRDEVPSEPLAMGMQFVGNGAAFQYFSTFFFGNPVTPNVNQTGH
jgi:hypothetical protein